MSPLGVVGGPSAPIGTPLTANVGGLPIFLPDAARGGYVYQDAIPFPVKVNEQIYRYTASGSYYDVPTSVLWKYTSSATVINRFPALQVLDQDGRTVFQAATPIPQTASMTMAYTFSALIGAPVYPAASASGAIVELPIPVVLLAPGWQIATFINAPGAGDTSEVPTLSRVRFQTGPTPLAEAAPTLAPIETPVLT